MQNLLALRFANGIFEPIWSRHFVDHVQITVAESIGIEGRAGFYEEAGAIRDVFQNHLLQLVALTAMEPPIDFTADSVRNEKVKVLRSCTRRAEVGHPRPVRARLHRGRGGAGVPRGARCRERLGHRDLRRREALRRQLALGRHAVLHPCRKRLPRRETTIAIQFSARPTRRSPSFAERGLRPNVLLIHVQPDEGVSFAIGAKVPGAGMSIRTVHMDFLYGGAFRTSLPEAYERLILDAMLGDATPSHAPTRSTSSGRSSTRSSPPGSGTGRRSRTTRPGAGGRRPRTTCSIATGGRGGGTEHRRPGGAAARRAAAGRGRGCGAAHERDDPRRVGAAEMGRRGAADARRAGGAPSLAHDPALPGARSRRLGRSGRLAPLLCPRRCVARGLHGGDRASSPRQARACAGLDRAAAPHLRPADVLPLARPAAVGRPELEQLVDVCDRLVVDSSEWRGLPRAYAELAELFDRIAVSDIAWGRGLGWRGRLASLWPGIATKRLSVTGPKADALLLAGWLRSRLGTRLSLTHRSAGALERVLVDGEPVEPPRGGPPSASDLLSGELDVFGRDPVYEAAAAQPAEVDQPVRRDVVEAAARLLDDDLHRRRVPDREPCGVEGRLGRTSATSMWAQKSPKPRVPGRPRRRGNGPVETVEEGRVLEPVDRRDADALPVRARAALGPPAAAERGGGDDREPVGVRDQRGPDRDPARVVPRPVDRIEDPARVVAPALLLAEDGLARALPLDPCPQRVLDGPVGLGDRRQVGLRLDAEVGCAKRGARSRRRRRRGRARTRGRGWDHCSSSLPTASTSASSPATAARTEAGRPSSAGPGGRAAASRRC